MLHFRASEGGFFQEESPASAVSATAVWLTLNHISQSSRALFLMFSVDSLERSNRGEFLAFQMCQRTHGNERCMDVSVACFLAPSTRKWRLRKTELLEKPKGGSGKFKEFQTSRAAGHENRTWQTVSLLWPHEAHLASTRIPRDLRFAFTARAPERAL